MAGKYEPNLSFIQWKDLTVDDLWIFQTPLSVSIWLFPMQFVLCSHWVNHKDFSGLWQASMVAMLFPPVPGSQLLPTSTADPSLALHPAGYQSLPGHVLQPNPVSSTPMVSVEELKAFSVSGELLHSKGTFLSELQCLSTSGMWGSCTDSNEPV